MVLRRATTGRLLLDALPRPVVEELIGARRDTAYTDDVGGSMP